MRQVCPKCKNEQFYVDEDSGYDASGDWSVVTLICTKCKSEEGVYAIKFEGGTGVGLEPKEEEE